MLQKKEFHAHLLHIDLIKLSAVPSSNQKQNIPEWRKYWCCSGLVRKIQLIN